MPEFIAVNGRCYRWPRDPVVVVCIDGSEPGYVEAAVATGQAPFFGEMQRDGANLVADCVVPSFTNPNNLSIVTGRTPDVHGISGNYFLDPDSGNAVMMNDPRFLRAPSVFAVLQQAGGRVVVVTAKDKLRKLLGHGLTFNDGSAVCFSSEKADRANLAENGIRGLTEFVEMAVPNVYSAALSEFVFRAAVKIMEQRPPDVMYLSTTDFIQHKYPPGHPSANDFYAMMDGYLRRLHDLGAVIAVTADHGMNDKHDPQTKQPNVLYLQDLLDGWYGSDTFRVILPITDPYVVHHGALGSFATFYSLGRGIESAAARLRDLAGIDVVLTREEACERYQLPADRVGDLVVISVQDHVLGARVDEHDLSGLTEPLRSHGGISEQKVPLILNRKVRGIEGRRLRNFDAFDLAFNHV